MTDPNEPPRLLLDDNADPIVRRLLRSGCADGPSERNLLAAPAAIAALIATNSISSAAAASAAVATAATASAAATTTTAIAATATGATTAAVVQSSSAVVATIPILIQSLGIGLILGGAAVATAVHVATPSESAPDSVVTAQVPSVSGRTVRVTGGPERIAVITQAQASETAVREPPAPKAANAPPNASQEFGRATAREARREPSLPVYQTPEISREVALLDAARHALDASDPSRTLQHLDAHATLKRRTLEPEATVLRVRALLAQHRHTEAAQVAKVFSVRMPSSPQTHVLDRLLADAQ